MARQKNVFKTAEIPHLWAHQTQQSARNHGNLFFDGDTIYSYGRHFPIARHVKNDRGEAAILFNNAPDSSTTSQHKSAVRAALPNNCPVFFYHAGRMRYDNLTLDGCLTSLQSAFTTSANNLKNAKSRPSKAKAYGAFSQSRAELTVFQRYIGVDETTNGVITEAEEREYIACAREHRDKVEVARINRNAKREEEMRAWREEREAEAKMTLAEKIEAWRNGGHVTLPYGTSPMIRIKGDTAETSMGATFPLEHAVKGLPLVIAIIDRGITYQRGASESIVRLGHYVIESIENGILTAGCHKVTYDEVRHFAGLVNQQIKAV